MNFCKILNGKKICLYGLGTETARVLNEWKSKYNIIGLLDGFRTSGNMYGYKILDINDVIKMSNVIIIIVARPSSCKTIVKRIREICMANSIALFDIRGNDLLEVRKVSYNLNNITGYKKDNLLKQIDLSDAVSFDFFDTLVMRSILSSDDIVKLTEAKLKSMRIIIPDFTTRRICTEKKLSRQQAPTLEFIYADLLTPQEADIISPEQLSQIEFDIDRKLLSPRSDVVELINYAKHEGKSVYITSDSYYTKKQIEKLLSDIGVSIYDDVIVSSEYNIGKAFGLYNKLIQKAGTHNIIHIGDDIKSDVEDARKYGVNAFHIFSGVGLFDCIGGMGLNENIQSLSDSIRVGMFISVLFNSPFRFENNKRNLKITASEQIGYLLCAPIFFDFTYWFGNFVKQKNITNVWFGSRDGYIIKKIFELIWPDVKSEYFYTSRIAAVRAGITDIKDLCYVDSMVFSGTASECLRVRFGIIENNCSDKQIKCTDVSEYSDQIMNLSIYKRKKYLSYLDTIDIDSGKIAFFDFVAKGTVQMFIQKLIANEMIGLYFFQLEPEFMKDKQMNIIPFYTAGEQRDSKIFEDYYILETILTSPEPSLEEFDSKGKPVFAEETRSDKDICCVMSVQNGILSYVEKYLLICPRNEIKQNKKLDEALFSLLHKMEICVPDFLKLTVEDPFFNRMTNIKDMI